MVDCQSKACAHDCPKLCSLRAQIRQTFASIVLDFELLFCQEEADGCQYMAALAEIMLLLQVDIGDIFCIVSVRLWH